MTDRVGKRESSFDGVFFDITPEKPNGPSPRVPLGDKEAIEQATRREGGGAYVGGPRAGTNKQKVEQALRDQNAGEYVDGPRLPSGQQALVDMFAKRHMPRAPGCARPRAAAVDMGTGSWGSIAKQNALGLQFTKLETKHEKVVGRLESSLHGWEAAKRTIAKQEKNPAARQQKLAYADATIGRIRTELRETRIAFGVVEHEYKVALGQEKRAAIGPAKPGDRILSDAELADLKKRTLTLEKRIEHIGHSGLIASASAFVYVVGTEAGGRTLDARDYRALDTVYAIGALGSSATPHVGTEPRDAGMNLEESTSYEARRAQ